MKKVAALALVLTLSFALAACGGRRGEIGSAKNPIRFFFMPLKGDQAFAANAPAFKKYIEQSTGLIVEPVAAPDFTTIVKAFGNNQADIAFMNTLGYLMARDWAKAEAHLMMLYGDVYRTYRGEFLAQVGGPISNPTDLESKTIAFGDPFSAASYLYPLKYMKDRGIKPGKTLFAGSHRDAVEMVYSGKVDAAATYHSKAAPDGTERDARAELLATHPDVFDKVKIVALTDEIPNGPVALRRNLPEDVKAKLVGALIEFSRTPAGRSALMGLYNASGLTPAADADYDGVGKVIKELGKSIEEVVPGGVTFYMQKISPLLEN